MPQYGPVYVRSIYSNSLAQNAKSTILPESSVQQQWVDCGWDTEAPVNEP